MRSALTHHLRLPRSLLKLTYAVHRHLFPNTYFSHYISFRFDNLLPVIRSFSILVSFFFSSIFHSLFASIHFAFSVIHSQSSSSFSEFIHFLRISGNAPTTDSPMFALNDATIISHDDPFFRGIF